MSHPTVNGPHTALELKKLDEESTDKKKNGRNPWILTEEPKDPQIIPEIFGNFAYESGGNIRVFWISKNVMKHKNPNKIPLYILI